MKPIAKSDLFRLLPSIDDLLRSGQSRTILERWGHDATVAAAREVSADLRARIASGEIGEAELQGKIERLPSAIEARVQASQRYSLRPVINATGVILHTNLGRAPLGDAALQHVVEVSRNYSNLEFDLASGERGKRDVHVNRLFAQMFKAAEREVSTIVVNNNAAAVLLALNALAEGVEVIVSRGELVEIGGSRSEE